jgi:hypothetical protein
MSRDVYPAIAGVDHHHADIHGFPPCSRLAGVFHGRSGMTTSGRWWDSSEELITIAQIS